MSNVCLETECQSKPYCRGYCRLHYARLMRSGTTKVSAPRNKGREFIEEIAVKYDGDDCLIWPYSFSGQNYNKGGGYPTYSQGRGKRIGAHRTVCEITNGAAPSIQHQAAHLCGNSRCLNPKHIAWKTPVENAQDKIRHDTHISGEKSANAKLTADDVRNIRRLHPDVSARNLAELFGVCREQIHNILSRRKWSNLD